MFEYKFQWKEHGATPKIALRQLNEMKRQAYTAAGVLWHRKFRPLHFTTKGATKYGYTPRSGEDMAFGSKAFWKSYTGRKMRHLGHRKPLVKSGTSMARTEQKDVRAKSTSRKSYVRVYLHAPAFNRRNPKSRIDMVKEMTTVTPDEVEAMAKEIDRVMQRQLKALK